jgi:hypothetical protein
MPKDFKRFWMETWRNAKRTRGFNKVKTTFNTQAEFIQKFKKSN